MTTVIPEGLEPLAVWDVDARTGPWAGRVPPGEAFCRSFDAACWLVGQIERARDAVRIEFYLYDAPFMVAYRIASDKRGKLYDPATCGPLLDEPVIVPLAELPPEHLLRTP
jgi:hypothetical protein